MHRRIRTLLGAACLLTAGAIAQTTSTTVTRQFSFPPVGLAGSETMQINVVNLASASSSGPAASCTGTIAFYNASGAIIGTATNFTVGSGAIFSASKAGSGARTEIRGVVTLTETRGSGVPCELASSLETFDTTSGAAHVHLATGVEPGGGEGPHGGPGAGGR